MTKQEAELQLILLRFKPYDGAYYKNGIEITLHDYTPGGANVEIRYDQSPYALHYNNNLDVCETYDELFEYLEETENV